MAKIDQARQDLQRTLIASIQGCCASILEHLGEGTGKRTVLTDREHERLKVIYQSLLRLQGDFVHGIKRGKCPGCRMYKPVSNRGTVKFNLNSCGSRCIGVGRLPEESQL